MTIIQRIHIFQNFGFSPFFPSTKRSYRSQDLSGRSIICTIYRYSHHSSFCFFTHSSLTAIFIFCAAVSIWMDRSMIQSHVYDLLPMCLCVVLVPKWQPLHSCVCESSPFQVNRQFVLHPVIMTQRYTHYIALSMRRCSKPLWREKADLATKIHKNKWARKLDFYTSLSCYSILQFECGIK